MATYKVIQDIEAEDKFLGPLTLKQFIFGAGGIFFGYLNILALTKNFPFAMIILLPPMLVGFFLAVPWSKDQPTEIWVLAKLRYYFKPRRRIWDQSGMEELVTITAPKKEEKQLTDNLSQNEVKSRLKVLAQTIDSRGWAIKEAPNATGYHPATNSDRLVGVSTLPHEVPPIDVGSIPDVYSEKTATSENFDRMIEQSAQLRMNQNLEKMNRIRNGEPLESIIEPPTHITAPTVTPLEASIPMPPPEPVIDEASLAAELRNRRAPDSIATAHMRKIQPLDAVNAPQAIDPSPNPFEYLMQNGVASTSSTPLTYATDDQVAHATQTTQNNDDTPVNYASENTTEQPAAAILEYASNNDLNIATIARQAKKDLEGDPDEVVVSLH